MAIKLTNLERISKQFEKTPFIYQDLQLDLVPSSHYDPVLNDRITENDVAVSYDEAAIRNSLRNLFNTRPGQRFLFPLYGLDLYQYLFEPITAFNAEGIGSDIMAAIEKFEPRVVAQKCVVTPIPDDNMYEIDVVVYMPSLASTITLNSALDLTAQSFVFIETSRNR